MPKDAPEIATGAVVCSVCGAGNGADRQFCHQCGNDLSPAPLAEPPADGPYRRSRRVPKRKLRVAVAAAAAIALVVVAAGPGRRAANNALEQLRSRRAAPVPIHPVRAAASSSVAGHAATAAIDGVRTTSWAEAASGDGVGQSLSVFFAGPVDLFRVGLIAGDVGAAGQALRQPRPHEVRLAFSDGSSVTLELKDTEEFQSFEVAARHTTGVQMTIRSVYPSGEGADCSVAELEFFSR
jgi:hypothetical protein